MLDGPEAGLGSRHYVDALLQVTKDRNPDGNGFFHRRHEHVGARHDHLHEVGPLVVLAPDLGGNSLTRSGIERGENGSGCLKQSRRRRPDRQRVVAAFLQQRRRTRHLTKPGDALGEHQRQARRRISEVQRVRMHVVVARHDESSRRIDAFRRRVLAGSLARGYLDNAAVSYPDTDVDGGAAVTGIDNCAAVEKQRAGRSGVDRNLAFARARGPFPVQRRPGEQAWT